MNAKGECSMHLASISRALPLLISLACAATADVAQAQQIDVPATWGGDFSSRARLTGDWGGIRDDLGKQGVIFDVDLLTTPQAVLSGGRNTGGNTWGNVDYILNIDTEKLGLWPGGFIEVSADSGLGSMTSNSGAIVAINTATQIPGPNDHRTVLMNAAITQFFGTKIAWAIGKFNTLEQGKEEFYGDYSTQFLNGAFNYPITTEQVPPSAFGAGVQVMPTQDVTLSVYAFDPSGTPASNDVGEAFDDGVIVTGGGQATIDPFNRVGHQSFGFTCTNKEHLSLEQDPSNLARLLLQEQFPRLGDIGPELGQFLARFFPSLLTPTQSVNEKSSSWSFNYAFDQYLWQPSGEASHGIGMFFSFGASDGNPNPVQYSYLAGMGGKGVVRSRPDDSFGVGVARTQFSSAFIPFLRQRLGLGLDHEDAFEAYYNVAITKWLTVSADFQVIDPALKKSLDASVPGLAHVRTAVVAGIRLRARL